MNTHASYPQIDQPSPRVHRHEAPATPQPSLAAEAAPLVVTVAGAIALVLIGAPLV
ncbi:MAG: hypothetical protein M3389_05060 [Actinomycetota bacterium]|nr:hypothetical protein [Actinomycetota bacterium]